jgi:hypothetical protein
MVFFVLFRDSNAYASSFALGEKGVINRIIAEGVVFVSRHPSQEKVP